MLKEELEDRHITRYWWIWLIGILGISVIIRLYFVPWNLPPAMDGIDYFAYSLEIRNLGELPENWPLGNNGWPSFMGLIFSIIPSNEFLDYVNFYRITNVIISTITIIPIYFISSKFFGKYLGLLGASLFAFEPKLIINSTMIMNEPIYILLITLIILLFFYKSSKNFIIVFGLIALAIHIKYESLIFIIPCTILFFLNYGKQNKYIKKYIIFLKIFLLVLIPFLVLNYVTTGHDGISNHYFSVELYDPSSPDGKLAEVAASDEVFLDRDVKVLKGGTGSWVEKGLPLEKGFSRMADDPNDVWYRPYDFKDGVEGAMKQYLSWEIDLLNQIKRDGTANFQII